MTALGSVAPVFTYGEEFLGTPQVLEMKIDRLGKCFLDLDKPAQRRRWGRGSRELPTRTLTPRRRTGLRA